MLAIQAAFDRFGHNIDNLRFIRKCLNHVATATPAVFVGRTQVQPPAAPLIHPGKCSMNRTVTDRLPLLSHPLHGACAVRDYGI